MANKVPDAGVTADCPPVPHGIIGVLEFYLAKAERGADRFRNMPRGVAEDWRAGSQLYWTQAAQGIRWVLGDCRKRLRAQRQRKS